MRFPAQRSLVPIAIFSFPSEALKAYANRIVLMAGRESRGYPTYQVNVELCKKLGRELIDLPGGHIGFISEPAEFSREFVQALVRTGHGPKR